METFTVLAGFLLVLLFLWSWYGSKNLPPGPIALPLLGSVFFMREFQTKRHCFLTEAEKRYGNVIGIRVGRQLIVFLQGYDVIYEAFVKHGAKFNGRPNWLRSLQQGTEQGKGVIWQTGEQWSTMRKFSIQTLRGFGVGKSSLEEKIFLEIDTFSRILNDLNGQPVVAKTYLKKGVANVIHDIVFGSRFDYEDKNLVKLIDLVERFFQGGLLIPQNFLPQFICAVMRKYQEVYKQKQALISDIKAYIFEQIEEHEVSYDDDNIRDFVDLYIQTCRTTNNTAKEGFTKGNIFRVIMDIFLAGAETTASTLDWCLVYMLKNPEVQQRCREEILQNVDTARVQWSDRTKLKYTEATLMEIQRLANIAPLGVPHTNAEDCTLAGYLLPANTIVLPNLYSASRDPKYWTDPETFRPERHLDDKGCIKKSPAWIPFSVGPRVCLGENLAKMELFLFFTNLLVRFNFTSPDERENIAAKKGEGQVTSVPTRYEISAVPRQDARG